jgi:hypothetical protein
MRFWGYAFCVGPHRVYAVDSLEVHFASLDGDSDA